MALVDRVQGVLLKPQQEWPVIAAEPDNVRNLLMTYVLPLAAIPAVCSTVGLAIFGVPVPFIGHLSYSPIFLILSLITGFIGSVATVFISAQIIDALAPTFGSQKNPVQAMKVATYGYIPAAIGGIFSLYPLLGFLGLLTGLYGIYQIYLGLRSTMGSPTDKAIGYTAVAIIVTIIAVAIVYVILGVALTPFRPALPLTHFSP